MSLHTRTGDADESDAVVELKLERDAWARASALQARLLATIDALDAARISNEQELSEAARAHDILRARLSAAQGALVESETEQSDMRNAVLQLIEKVEVCNDYSRWPHSSILLSSFAYPASPASTAIPSQNRIHEPPEAFRAYAASVISALRVESDRERAMHQQTRIQLGARIAVLEAMIAQREVELEQSTACSFCHRGVMASTRSAEQKRIDMRTGASLTKDDAIRLLEQSAARNRSLSAENEGLAMQLRRARAVLWSPATSPDLQFTQESAPPPENKRQDSPERNLNSSPPLAGKPSRSKLPRPPTPRRTRPHTKVILSEDENERGIPWGLDQDERSKTHTRISPHSRSQGRRGDQEQISPLHQDMPPRKRSFEDIMSYERECIRLRSALASAEHEIERLRSAVGPRPPAPDFPQSTVLRAASPQRQSDPFADDLSERSMELASPFQPTLTLNQSYSPPLVPLPPSPTLSSRELLPSPAQSSPVLPVFSLDPDLDTAELERVRSALEIAEERLRTQDIELIALRDALQIAAAARRGKLQ